MNEARAEELGLKPLETELAAIDRLQTKTDLARYFARMFKLNLINPLVGYVDGDAQQPDRDILYVVQGGLGSSRSRLLPEERSQAAGIPRKYVAMLTTLLQLRTARPLRARRPRRSSRSKRAWRAPTGPTSRAATR